MDNSQDKGYLMLRLIQNNNNWHLCPIGFSIKPGEENFHVDYENGTIFVDPDNETRRILGYYDTTVDDAQLANVYDKTRTRIIGRVGAELIYFRAREHDVSVGRYMPDEECLAWYTKAGSIKPKGHLEITAGLICDGSNIGGAAAFVATFFTYDFKSIYCDYFDMDVDSFKEKYKFFLSSL